VPAGKDLAQPSGVHGLAPPIVLNFAQAFRSNDARAKIQARKLGRRRRDVLYRVVDRGVDRLDRQVGAVEIEQLRAPSKSNLVVEFVGRHQRSAGGSVGLARDHTRAGFSGDALVAEIAGDHSLTNEGERGG
jgi:hypothetical protein